jgi:hypothetical protein
LRYSLNWRRNRLQARKAAAVTAETTFRLHALPPQQPAKGKTREIKHGRATSVPLATRCCPTASAQKAQTTAAQKFIATRRIGQSILHRQGEP